MSSKDIQLKPEVTALAEKLKAGITLDSTTGIGSAKEDLYDSNLPETLTPAIVKEVSDFNTTFVAAGAFAFGSLAVEAMAGNKNLERATVEIGMGGKDNLNLSIDRSKTFNNHLAGGGETVKFGIVTPGYEVVAGKNAGQLKKARLLVGELAAAALQ